MHNHAQKSQNPVLVVDANILVRDFWLEGAGWTHLLRRNLLLHTLVVPRVALDEATAALHRRADELLVQARESGWTDRLRARAARIFGRQFEERETADELASRYREFIEATVAAHAGLIVEPPAVDLRRLIDRSISRTKPFNAGDKGFRDTLIWLNVVELAARFERVSFVSGNTTDFAHGKRIHPELGREVDAVIPTDVIFHYFTGIDEFVEFIDRDGDAGANSLRVALLDGRYRDFSLDEWLEDAIVSGLEFQDIDDACWTGVPAQIEDLRLEYVDEVIGVDLFGQRVLGDELIDIYCSCSFIGGVAGVIPFGYWKGVVRESQIIESDDQSNPIGTEVSLRMTGSVLLRLVFDLRAARVRSYAVVPIGHALSSALESIRDEVASSDQDCGDDG